MTKYIIIRLNINSGELHRIGGSAIEIANGGEYWYENGKSVK